MTLACSFGAGVVIGHVGDSRVYLFRGGRLHQLTRDHTYVQALMDLGQLNAAEAARHPLRHVLTRSLGGSEHGAEGDFQRAQLADGDQLLLCTDGLTNMVDDATVGSVLGRGEVGGRSVPGPRGEGAGEGRQGQRHGRPGPLPFSPVIPAKDGYPGGRLTGPRFSDEVHLGALDEDFVLGDQRCCSEDRLQLLKKSVAGLDGVGVDDNDGVVVPDRLIPFG